MKLLGLYLFSIFLLSIVSAEAQISTLEISVKEIRNNKGRILYAIFDNETDYKKGKSFIRGGEIKTQKGKLSFFVDDLPDGVYAISILHDENANEKMDLNILGIPKEGFGYSNNPVIRFGKPSYEDIKFPKKGKTKIEIKMKYFL